MTSLNRLHWVMSMVLLVSSAASFYVGVIIGRKSGDIETENKPIAQELTVLLEEEKKSELRLGGIEFYERLKELHDAESGEKEPHRQQAVADDKSKKLSTKPEPEDAVKGKQFTVQVSVFNSKESAAKMVNSLKRNGYPAYVLPFNKGDKKTRYHVCVGKYKTKKDAADAHARMKKDRLGSQAVIVALEKIGAD